MKDKLKKSRFLGIEIKPLKNQSITIVNDANELFLIIGKVIPKFFDGVWSYDEELYDTPSEIRFPDDKLDWSAYIDSSEKIVLLAFREDACVGQIRLVKDWNRFAYIENIAVRSNFRKTGVGHLLLEAAETWAKEHSLIGLSLEAQNDNLIACRFYAKEGFVLGGVDTLKQSANFQIDIILYWYKIFPKLKDLPMNKDELIALAEQMSIDEYVYDETTRVKGAV
ncbi:GNAT family N-acetyltransferase [Exiguobacterium antarcticum]|uniref:GNAT family N-acetyltransferase n=1 Tax=Exiguobacterium antarcticum TaxID=132920 RepID=UPI000285ECBC|nr:GNAT family N-acetyltransferase [Exiguobacterium antarcticum]AFS71662.1 GCN5-related N-acetyltransferase [Exiguobacterium antarcticum B7]